MGATTVRYRVTPEKATARTEGDGDSIQVQAAPTAIGLYPGFAATHSERVASEQSPRERHRRC